MQACRIMSMALGLFLFSIVLASPDASAQTSSAATFVRSDTTTQGNWHGTYGADGYSVAEDSQNLPSYAFFALQNQQDYTWLTNTADPRALQTGNGSGRIAATWYNSSSFSLDVNFADGNSHQLALYAVDWDNQGRSETVQILDATTAAVLDTRSISSFTGGAYLVWNISGHVTINVTQNSGPNAVVSGVFFGGSSPITSSASFLRSDTTTQGNWHAAYGADGYSVASDSQSLPSYGSFAVEGEENWTWNANSADVRALQTGSGSGRIAATWYSASNFSFDVNFTDGNLHQIALYAVDWDTQGRSETIQVQDAATEALLDTRVVSAFTNGVYLLWNVSGHVTISVIGTAGPNAVVSGVFFGGSSTITSTAAFVKADAATQGNWQGTYGADGYSEAASAQSLPAYASFAVQNEANWTWDANPTDPRALETGTGSGRIAATWYNNPSFNFDVNLTDGNTHQVSLYAVDYDSQGRTETIQVLDSASEALLDTETLPAFTSGVYLVWNISGHVRLNVIGTSGPNAVISGVFFDPASGGTQAPILTSIMVTPANPSVPFGNTQQFTAMGTYSDGSTQDLTSAASWSSSAFNVASINSAGLATSVAQGTTTITATFSGFSSSATLSVTPGVPVSIAVSPQNSSLALGLAEQFIATGIYADGSTQNLTTSVVWGSSNTSVVTISNAMNAQGLAAGISTGTASISATLAGTSYSTTVTVAPAGALNLPSIVRLSPVSGAVGDTITIYGSNFGATQGTVTFNGVAATASWNGITITAPVPARATTGPVVVTTASGAASNPVNFTVGTPDTITGLTITSPTNGAVLSTPYATVMGSFTGSASGIDPIAVVCNDVQATLSGYNFSCNVPLSAGVNSVTATGTDSAGDSATATVSVTLTMPAPASLTITPGPANMLIGQTQSFTAMDDQGLRRPDATWSVSNNTIAAFVSGSPNTLIGVAVGQTTLTATIGSISSQTQVTVLAGSSLPVGTVLWSAPVVPGYSAAQIVQAVPTVNGPDLYSIDTDTSDQNVLVRAFQSDGEQLWQNVLTSNGYFYYALAMGDNSGGLLIETQSYNNSTSSQMVDLNAQTGAQNWAYTASGPSSGFYPPLTANAAVGLDGTVYVVETDYYPPPGPYWQGYYYLDYLDAISGKTGALVNQIPLPQDFNTATDDDCDGGTPGSFTSHGAGSFGPPMVAPDGSVYMEMQSSSDSINIQATDPLSNYCANSETYSESLSLLRVLPGGGTQIQPLDSYSVSAGPIPYSAGLAAQYDIPGGVIPDGQGGVLASWQVNTGHEPFLPLTIADIGPNASAQSNFSSVFSNTQLGSGGANLVLGDNNTAFVTDGDNAVSFNIPSLQPNWTYASTGGYLSFVAATSGGGVTINDSQQGIIQLDQSGNPSTPVPSLQGATYFGNSLWVGLTGDPVLAEFQGNYLSWASSAWAFLFGSKSMARAPQKPDFELDWCTGGLCSGMEDPSNPVHPTPLQDVVFSILGDDPPNVIYILTPAQIKTAQLDALIAFQLAFEPYNVHIGTGRQGTNTVYVVGNGYPACGGTAAGATARSVIYYQFHVAEAQHAVNDTAGNPTVSLLGAIGEGIGNDAAHEIAWELSNAWSQSKFVGTGEMDDDTPDTYNSLSCDGSDAPWVYTGYDEKTPIYWEQGVKTSLMNILGSRQ